jgi:hypothetical protein
MQTRFTWIPVTTSSSVSEHVPWTEWLLLIYTTVMDHLHRLWESGHWLLLPHPLDIAMLVDAYQPDLSVSTRRHVTRVRHVLLLSTRRVVTHDVAIRKQVLFRVFSDS